MRFESTVKINTTNTDKATELKTIFASFNTAVIFTNYDLREIYSDPFTVAVHKASQLEDGIIVDDVSLLIEGTDIGVDIKFRLNELRDLKGKNAKIIALLAVKNSGHVTLYKGEVNGSIVAPQGPDIFGFDNIFMPEGSNMTLAESKPNIYNPRYIVVENYIKNHITQVSPTITDWKGLWQSSQ